LLTSETINLLDSGVNGDFVEMGSLSRVVVDVGLVEFVDAAHVGLQGKGRAHATESTLLREKRPVHDSAHGHVRPIPHTQLLQLSPFILFKRASAHLLCRVQLEVSVEGLSLGRAVEAASFGGECWESRVLKVHHLLFSLLFLG